MSLADISARYEGSPFVDPFDSHEALVSAAKNRLQLAAEAERAGKSDEAARHRKLADDYERWARDFHNRIDWSDE